MVISVKNTATALVACVSTANAGPERLATNVIIPGIASLQTASMQANALANIVVMEHFVRHALVQMIASLWMALIAACASGIFARWDNATMPAVTAETACLNTRAAKFSSAGTDVLIKKNNSTFIVEDEGIDVMGDGGIVVERYTNKCEWGMDEGNGSKTTRSSQLFWPSYISKMEKRIRW